MSDQYDGYGSPTLTDEGGDRREKRNSGPPGQPRAKRARYISNACNECKRRKIKCNGQTPCQRCGHLNLQCLYTANCCSNNFKDTEEFRLMNDHISSLQQQVDSLFQSVAALRSELSGGPNIDPALRNTNYEPHTPFSHATSAPTASESADIPHVETKAVSQNAHLLFEGPTSTNFGFDVARNSLQSMGITAPEVEVEAERPRPEKAHRSGFMYNPDTFHADKDPIWALNKAEALRLCEVYAENDGLTYPFVDMEMVTKHARMLYTFIEAVQRSSMFHPERGGADSIDDSNTDMLKLALAAGLVLEGNGSSVLGQKLYENVRMKEDPDILGTPSKDTVVKLAMKSRFHYYCANGGSAWRTLGVAARMCVELGMHRADTYAHIQDEKERALTLRLFWSVHCLDRLYSLGVGMPLAFPDEEIDPDLARPDDSTPYLKAMTGFSYLGSRIWNSIACRSSVIEAGDVSCADEKETQYLDHQVKLWQQSLPELFRYIHPGSDNDVSVNMTGGRELHRIRVLMHLRVNQLRIIIYRPALYSATSILSPIGGELSRIAVEIAKDSIQTLTLLNQTSDVYRTNQMCYNYFLGSALAVLFLAVSHAPAVFAESVREEFYMALDLVRILSATSAASQRLWKTIKGLKDIAPKLGVYAGIDRNSQSNVASNNGGAPTARSRQSTRSSTHDAHSSAAMAMAGLAGHPVDESVFFNNSSATGTPVSHINAGPGASANSGLDIGADCSNAMSNPLFPGTIKSQGVPPSTNPDGMANELGDMFEAIGGWAAADAQIQGDNAVPRIKVGSSDPDNGQARTGSHWSYGHEEQLEKVVREWF